MLPCSLELKLQLAVLAPQRPVTSLPASFAFFKFFSFMHLRTLPSSVSCKSFACHSYENCRVCTNNSQSGTPRAPAGEPGPAEILLPSTSVSVNSMFSVDSVLIPASPHSPRFTDHYPLSPIPFLFRFFRTLLHLRKTQVFCFQAIPSSLHKTPGGGVYIPVALVSHWPELANGPGRLSSNASFLNFQLSTVNLLRAVLLMSAASAILEGQK